MVRPNPNHPTPPRPGSCGQGKEPTAREAIRLAAAFSTAVGLSEEIARGGKGGVVRIKELAPVVDAMKAYLACLPAGVVER